MTTAELVEAGREWGKPLTEADARELTAQIRTSVLELLPLIRTAFRRRADLALGYAGWHEYCDAELSGLRLSLGDRLKAVGELRSDGMSQRAIGSALGISAATVNRTLATVSDETVPDRVTGIDGKDRPATRPTPKTPGPVDSTTLPADPGTTPAPADLPPDPQEPNLTADIVRVLGDVPGVAGELGLTVAEIWAKLPDVHSSSVQAAVDALAEAGRVEPAGRVLRGNRMEPRWLLAESATGECVGADMDCGRPLPCPDHPRTPEERIAAVAEVAPEFVQPVADQPLRDVPTVPAQPASREAITHAARRSAERIVARAQNDAEIIVAAVDLGEDLPVAELIAGLQAAIDVLASRLEVRA